MIGSSLNVLQWYTCLHTFLGNNSGVYNANCFIMCKSSLFLELLKLVPSGNSIFDATNLLTGSPWGCGNNSCRSQSCGTSFLFLTSPHSLRLCLLSIPSSFFLKGLSLECPNDLVNCHPVVNASLSRNTYRKFNPWKRREGCDLYIYLYLWHGSFFRYAWLSWP